MPLAGKSTLNRLELAQATGGERRDTRRLPAEAVDHFLVDTFLNAYRSRESGSPSTSMRQTTRCMVIKRGGSSTDTTDATATYRCTSSAMTIAGARLRPSDIDAATGSLDELIRIVGQIRDRWPDVQIIVRGDSGFARNDLMTWCEDNGVDYVFGLARNNRLVKMIFNQLKKAKKKYWKTGRAARCYRDFRYRTLKSWNRVRRVIGKRSSSPKERIPDS